MVAVDVDVNVRPVVINLGKEDRWAYAAAVVKWLGFIGGARQLLLSRVLALLNVSHRMLGSFVERERPGIHSKDAMK